MIHIKEVTKNRYTVNGNEVRIESGNIIHEATTTTLEKETFLKYIINSRK